ncbi:hypothetical protein LEP1GSC082_2576 [Leptospira kirschneri str. H2]|uniref:Uncharacterized protein n=3 Tax=Leptospira kirschneri TaxID=29507 RepID=A0A0E2BE56_9LEPT|nr:hypothetical protein LEP1GSC081_1117 [Leptospira kirschneri str. H1]EKO60736.1 hypothetical protein LEP1GSC082_2576 [Leptospira kirschneri str. H2]EMK23799.1 hypothetical protein LEP1GSC008_3753 [Leptospira kirschneri serovar Bulgarica str. Nikolaevo]
MNLNILNLESVFFSTKKIIGDYMKRKPYWKLLISTFLILGLLNCSQSKENNDEEIASLLAIVNATNLRISGNWTYYNGTPSYLGDEFNTAGTVKSGDLIITNSYFKQTSVEATGSNYEADILEYDNTKEVIYVKFITHPFGGAGKYSAYYWTLFSDNKFYFCGDIAGNKNSLAEIKESTQRNDKTNMNSGCYTNNSFTPGTGFIWFRMETK